jgi:DNA-binding CsgD family transcriptional regulator
MTLDTGSPVHAIAFVIDPSQHVRPATDVLRTLFGLTPAECRVALLLSEGYAPPAIVDLIGISANTLKTQLASIYGKTALRDKPNSCERCHSLRLRLWIRWV